MVVHQCDNCKEVIPTGEQVILGRDTIRTYIELCPMCAAPIMTSLKNASVAPKLKEKIKEKSQYEDF